MPRIAAEAAPAGRGHQKTKPAQGGLRLDGRLGSERRHHGARVLLFDEGFTASLCSPLTSFCRAGLSLLSSRATRMFTYGDSAPSMIRASSAGLRPASRA